MSEARKSLERTNADLQQKVSAALKELNQHTASRLAQVISLPVLTCSHGCLSCNVLVPRCSAHVRVQM